MSKERHLINRDVFEGRWKEIQGQARERWGRRTGNDLERSEGQADQLIGRLQQKYGHAHTDSGAALAGHTSIVFPMAEGDRL